MKIFEFESDPTSTIISVAEVIRTRAANNNAPAKMDIGNFLQMVNNAGHVSLDYSGLKAYFDAEPKLANVIQAFNDQEIVFVGHGDEEETAELTPPSGKVPPEEKVNKMAKRAMKARESIEEGPMWDRVKAMLGVGKDTPGTKAYKDLVAKAKARNEKNKKKDESVKEDDEYGFQRWEDEPEGYEQEESPVVQAVLHRLMRRHLDVVGKHGPDKVMDAVNELADFVGDVEEIGSSDVSIWTKEVIDELERGPQPKGLKPTASAQAYMDQMDASHAQIYDKKIGESVARGLNRYFEKQKNNVSEGKSPHKKGTKKYKKHMAAKHAGMREDNTDYKKNVMDILRKFPAETKKMKMDGDVFAIYNTDLYMALYDYFSEDMPYGTQTGRDGDPVEWINDELDRLGLLDEIVELAEGYEGEVIKVLKKAKIASYFSNGILYVERGDGKDAIAALKKAPNIKELPKVREEKPRRDESIEEGYYVMPPIDRERYTDIPGLEGPFMLRSGKVVYYDPKEGQYYDRDSDMYMSYEEYMKHDSPSMQQVKKEETDLDEIARSMTPMRDKFGSGKSKQKPYVSKVDGVWIVQDSSGEDVYSSTDKDKAMRFFNKFYDDMLESDDLEECPSPGPVKDYDSGPKDPYRWIRELVPTTWGKM